MHNFNFSLGCNNAPFEKVAIGFLKKNDLSFNISLRRLKVKIHVY